MEKKAALIIYPNFSNYEISIVLAVLKSFDKSIVTFSADPQQVDSEEGLHIMPDKTFEDFCKEDFDCIILPGMWSFPEVLDDHRYTRFLKQFQENDDILIAGISSSAILLAKAGLLKHKKHCIGLFEEDIDKYDYINRENIVRAPLVKDENLITALGLAYREFGLEVGKALNLDCNDNWYTGIKEPINEEDYIYYRNPR